MLEKIALKKGIISKKVYAQAVAACKSAEHYEVALKEYFLSHKLMSMKTIEHLTLTLAALRTLKKNIRFGDLALKLELIDKNQLDSAITEQEKRLTLGKQPKQIGQILLESGLLNQDQINLILNEQKKANLKLKALKEKLSIPHEGSSETKPIRDNSVEKQKAPPLFPISGGMQLSIDEDGMAAYLNKTKDFDDSITSDDIYAALDEHMVQYGLVSEQMVDGFISSGGFREKPFKVAKGKEKVTGRDARIEYHFDTAYLKAGGMDKEGNIDFKQRGNIPKIEKGSLLAEKIPLKESHSGWDVYGQELTVVPSKDIEIQSQTGTYLSDDKNKLYAEISGVPVLTLSGYINVLDEFLVKGDVGYETGHINYEGNIRVEGCLKSGFRIKGNHIQVNEVDGGEIHAEGDVIILTSINDATIYSKGNVSAKFIHHSKISCLGNLMVEKELIDSKVDSGSACQIPTGDVINSKITANKGVFVKNLGTERSRPNLIQVGENIYLEKEIKRMDEQVKALGEEKEELKHLKMELMAENTRLSGSSSDLANTLENSLEKLEEIKRELDQEGPEEDQEIINLKKTYLEKKKNFARMDNELNSCFEQMETNDKKIEDLALQYQSIERKINDLNIQKEKLKENDKDNPGQALVQIQGRICTGTMIIGPNCQKEIMDPEGKVTLREALVQGNGPGSQTHEILIQNI